VERLRSGDLALLAAESARSPRHDATLEVFDAGGAPDRLDHDRLVSLVGDRLAYVPRYRQRLRWVPGRLANPVWVDDDGFDLTYHVRRSALPRPGSMGQLRDLTARIVSRRLDRDRPLWELYVVEGLEGDRVAVLVKSHQILVDGVSTVDLGQVLLDDRPAPAQTVPVDWRPRRPPGPGALVLGALRDAVGHPRQAVGLVRGTASEAARAAGVTAARAGRVAAALASRGAASESPFHVRLSEQRRYVTVRTPLAEYRAVREVHGGTVNDVVLATVTGALRGWLMTRAEPLSTSRSVRAMVPLGVLDSELEATSLGSQVVGALVDLPVGEPSPVVRLHQVSYALKAHRETGRAVAADRLAGVSGFAPTTFHALGSRVAMSQARRGFDLVVTNVPGPQFPLYAAGARMRESYPVQPLLPGHALAVGVTSYDGGVHLGITGDRDAVPDLDVLAQCVEDSLAELVDSCATDRGRAARGRAAPAARTRAGRL
jgi:diacylglycerol O-acyltransferase